MGKVRVNNKEIRRKYSRFIEKDGISYHIYYEDEKVKIKLVLERGKSEYKG